MQSSAGPELLHAFLHFLKESDEDLSKYTDILFALGKSMMTHPAEQTYFFDLDEYIQCILRLFDRTEGCQNNRSTCLDIFDFLFMSNMVSYRPMAEYLDDADEL